jgi:hypothetical protein
MISREFGGAAPQDRESPDSPAKMMSQSKARRLNHPRIAKAFRFWNFGLIKWNKKLRRTRIIG